MDPNKLKTPKRQTLMKDFPKDEVQIPELVVPFKKRRGRKPSIVAKVDADAKPTETLVEMSAHGVSGEECTAESNEIKDVEVTEMKSFVMLRLSLLSI